MILIAVDSSGGIVDEVVPAQLGLYYCCCKLLLQIYFIFNLIRVLIKLNRQPSPLLRPYIDFITNSLQYIFQVSLLAAFFRIRSSIIFYVVRVLIYSYQCTLSLYRRSVICIYYQYSRSFLIKLAIKDNKFLT